MSEAGVTMPSVMMMTLIVYEKSLEMDTLTHTLGVVYVIFFKVASDVDNKKKAHPGPSPPPPPPSTHTL